MPVRTGFRLRGRQGKLETLTSVGRKATERPRVRQREQGDIADVRYVEVGGGKLSRAGLSVMRPTDSLCPRDKREGFGVQRFGST